MLNQIKNWPTRMVGRADRIYSLHIRAANAYAAVIFGGSSAKMERARTDCGTCNVNVPWLLGAHCILGNCSGPLILLSSIFAGLEVFVCLCHLSKDKTYICICHRSCFFGTCN